MTIAAKHFDPILGVDVHILLMPPVAAPVPVPNPYVGMVMDPFDYIPFIGASVYINNLPRAQAGTGGMAMVPHLPLGGPFGPPPPSNESEVFMGSATVAIDGDAQSYLGLPVLTCQSIGMPAPLRPKGQAARSLVLPTSVVLSIPMGPPVLIGGPPTISLMALGMRGLFAALGPLGRGLRKLQRGSGRVGTAMRAATRRARRAGDALANALKLGANGRNRVNRAICTVTGHPVDVATGKVFTDKLDLELPGPIPLRWERVWYSTSTYQGPLGHGWHHSYDAALYVRSDVVLYRTPDARLVSFPPLAQGEEHFDRSERLSLIRELGGYAVRTSGQLLYRFRDIGRAEDEHVLSSISDPVGHVVQLHYDDRGRIAELIDSAGRVLSFKHDASGRLTAIDAPHPDRAGERFTVVQYAYDDRGNLVLVLDALNAPFRYRYQRHLLAQETDRNGHSFYFEYDAKDEAARCVHTWGDGGIYDHKLSYDDVHELTTVVNSLGYKTQYQHSAGLVVRTVDALGGTTLVEYDDYNSKLTSTDPIGNISRWAYDERGNVRETISPGGSKLTLSYGPQDLPLEARDAMGGVWRWQYDDLGRLTERINPLEDTTRLEYAAGRLVAVRDPAGHSTRLEYDREHNLCALHAPDGSVRRWEHDALGRITAVMNVYGKSQRRSYDLLGRVTGVVDFDGHSRELEYDREGNIVRGRDARHDVRFKYQGMGRLVARSEAGKSVGFEYDREERLIGVSNERGLVYRFELDPVGRVEVEQGFDGGRRAYGRDLAGRVTAVTRASGQRIGYTHDRAGRVVAVTYPDGAVDRYSYRLDGELVSAQNATIALAFKRDALRRIVREMQGGCWVSSTYDARGLRIRLQSSLGADQVIDRNELGDVIGLTHAARDSKSSFSARFSRDLHGLELERSLPGGVRSRWRRDELGRPLEQDIAVGELTLRTRSYKWDDDDRLQTVIDASQGPAQYGHDALGHLTWARYADGVAELRAPDAVGNLFRREDRSDRKYGPAGQLLEATDDRGRVTHYAYDADGNLIEKRCADGRRWRYRWGFDGTLREVERPDSTVVTFGYDPLGRRVFKSHRGLTTRWVWDRNVPLHEWVEGSLETQETASSEPSTPDDALIKVRSAALSEQLSRGPPELGSAASPITWVFEPHSHVPVAKLVANRCFSILSDHLGAPNLMLDERGATVWSADVGTWGQLRNGEGDRSTCPFRWPGQYEDAETGLHYNRFRYYDPESGQYCSADPLGLAGGLRPYGYPRDPLSHIDPLGLEDIVFRAMRPEDMTALDAGQPLSPRVPTANAAPIDHVFHGSSPTYPGDQFISMTRDRGLAENWARRSGTEVAEIDLDRVTSPVLDLSTGEGRLAHLGDPSAALPGSQLHTANRNARGASELLSEGQIPHAAVVGRYCP